MRVAYLCDFDGTVSPQDIGAALVRRFTPGGPDPELAAMLTRWRRGEVGHRALTEAECRRMRASRDEALEFARGFALDPDFAGFVSDARARGDAVMVVSEGFDFYVADHLERQGLADLPWAANRARFEEGRIVPEFPWGAEGCGRCGNCKGQHARRWRADGYHVVTVGDGLSDRCGAEASDEVLARGGLLDWCRERAIDVFPFDGFADVRAHARRLDDARTGRT